MPTPEYVIVVDRRMVHITPADARRIVSLAAHPTPETK